MIALIVILIMCSPVLLGILFGAQIKAYLDANPPKTNEEMSQAIKDFGEKLKDFGAAILTFPIRLFSGGKR